VAQDAHGSDRIQYIDFSRAALFALGILLHSAWLLKAHSLFLADLHDFIHSFRMESFFLIAGFFSGMTLNNGSPENYLRNRLYRLLLPLLFWGTVVNIELNCALRDNWHNLSFLETSAYWLNEEWLGHLWFIGTLLSFVIVLYVLHRCIPRLPQLIPVRFLNLPVLLASTVALHRGLLFLNHHTINLAVPLLITNGYQILDYIPYFLAGYVLFHHKALLNRIIDGVVFNFSGVALFWISEPFLHSYWGEQVLQMWRVLYSLQACALLFWIARRHFNKPNPHVHALSEASYTIYLVHWPLMAVLYRASVPLHLPVLLWFVLLACVTSVLSYGLHSLVIARSKLLLFLLNGRCERTPRPIRSLLQPSAETAS